MKQIKTRKELATAMDRLAFSYGSYGEAPKHIRQRWDRLNNEYQAIEDRR